MKPLLELFDIIIAYFHACVKSANGFIFQKQKSCEENHAAFHQF